MLPDPMSSEAREYWQNHMPSREAKDALICGHLRLVMQMALQHRTYKPSYCPDDAFQEGCRGLVVAAERYERGRGANFTTYARHWIRKYILAYKAKSPAHYRLPIHYYAGNATPEQREQVKQAHDVAHISGNLLIDDSQGDPLQALIEQEALDNITPLLTERQRTILEARRMGVSYTQIGERYGISKQAVRVAAEDLRGKIQAYAVAERAGEADRLGVLSREHRSAGRKRRVPRGPKCGH